MGTLFYIRFISLTPWMVLNQHESTLTCRSCGAKLTGHCKGLSRKLLLPCGTSALRLQRRRLWFGLQFFCEKMSVYDVYVLWNLLRMKMACRKFLSFGLAPLWSGSAAVTVSTFVSALSCSELTPNWHPTEIYRIWFRDDCYFIFFWLLYWVVLTVLSSHYLSLRFKTCMQLHL